MDEMQKYYIDLFEHNGGKIEGIPLEYRTKKMWLSFMEKGGVISKVPEKYKDEEFYKMYVATKSNPIFDAIPMEYRTRDVCQIFASRMPRQIYKLPPEFVTSEMWIEYLEKGGSFKNIPSSALTQDFYKKYMSIGGSIKNVPTKYVDTEDIENYLRNGGKEFPYIVENFYKKFNQNIANIVFDYMINSKLTILLDSIPIEFINESMVNKYIESGKSLSGVPLSFITQELCNKYISLGGNLVNVPSEFITQELCDTYINMGGKGIDKIPLEYRTQELYDKYLELGGNPSNVPLKYKDEPKKEPARKLIDLEEVERFKEYLLITETDNITKEDAMLKLDLSAHSIDKLLEYLSEKEPELYEKTKHVFAENQRKFYFSSIGQLKLLEKILNVMNYEHELTKEQKIYFSYLYGKIENSISLVKLYQVQEGKDEFPKFNNFCKKELGLQYVKTKDSGEILTDKERFLSKNSTNWLNNFDVNKRMNEKNSKAVKYMYLTKDDEQIEITPDIATSIVNKLKENGISNKVCIVEEAFKKYANEELDKFINDLISGEYLLNNKKGFHR